MQHLSSEELKEVTDPLDPVLEGLIKARNFLSDPKRWHKGATTNLFENYSAVRECGAEIHPKLAVCSLGATSLLIKGLDRKIANDYLLNAITDSSIPTFNDHPYRKHEDILEMFDKAIANRRAKLQEKD